MPYRDCDYTTECFRAQALEAKKRAERGDGAIALDWRRIANIYDELADVMEKWSRLQRSR